MNELQTRAADIRLLVLDVDGVLTDGRLYFSHRGEEMKSFHVRDGAGIVQLLRTGVEVAVISGRKSAAVDHRMRELGVPVVKQGVKDKLRVLTEILDSQKLSLQQVGCVGDDTPDVPMLQVVRFAVAVADAHPTARAAAHWITNAAGGCGAVREVCDLIVSTKS